MRRNREATLWLPAFRSFLKLVKVPSKETVEPQAIKLYRAQELFLGHICEGLERDIHYFVCLKARQLGISTIMQLFDIFWLYMHKGLQGSFIADTGENKEIFRQTFSQMLDSLPRQWRIPITKHDRSVLGFANDSRLQYMSAGRGKNSSLGRSRALNFVHGTECSSWGDQKGLDSLRRSLAETNPNRLYVFESTALGFNLFHDMYYEAKRADDQKAFFIGWWAKDTYEIDENSEAFAHWWGEKPWLTGEEQEKCGLVSELYNWDVTLGQIAWYRQQEFEQSSESLAEELPWTENEAWVATGTPFFSRKRVTEDMQFISQNPVKFNGYGYELGTNFTKTIIRPSENIDDLDLRVWEEPVPTGKYVIGVDPAYGRSEQKDRSVVSVWRCYADKCVQAAEYATHKPESQQVAWVLAHLAGCYRDSVINLEISGPGYAVFQEMKHLRDSITFGQLRQPAKGLVMGVDALNAMRWYLYHRPDSMGIGYAYCWKTSWENKMRLFNVFRDTYNTNQLIARSVPLLEEMTKLRQDGDSIQAEGRNKDDRCFAAALACMAWAEWVRPGMMANNMTYDRVKADEKKSVQEGGNVVQYLVQNWFNNAEAERAAAARKLLERY